MDITSPSVVISLIVAVFAFFTYIGATTKEDGHESH